MLLRMSQAANYIYREYSVVRCTKAIRNWYLFGYKVGDKRIYLKVEIDNMGEQYTRTEWLDKFIEKVGAR